MTADMPFDTQNKHICSAWGCSRVITEAAFMCHTHFALIPEAALQAVVQVYTPDKIKKLAVASVCEAEAQKHVV